jgi:hypothetical protein
MATELDDSAVFGYLMVDLGHGGACCNYDLYNALQCKDCDGWTVFVGFGDDEDGQNIVYSSCRHDDVCPDCLTDFHPGCCGASGRD